jgi:hypothetical protein
MVCKIYLSTYLLLRISVIVVTIFVLFKVLITDYEEYIQAR